MTPNLSNEIDDQTNCGLAEFFPSADGSADLLEFAGVTLIL
jgi:hypothetical protein